MKRRRFLRSAASPLALWPLTARSQAAALPVVGFLASASAQGQAPMVAAFRQGLSAVGYVEGTNVVVEYRWADDDYGRLPALAADLVKRRVTAIFTTSPGFNHVKVATREIPIIFITGDDPVQQGFVESFNRPTGNSTGVTFLSGELAAKRLEVLSELVPHAQTIAVLVNTDFGPSEHFQSDATQAARALHRQIEFLRTNNEQEIDGAFARLARARVDALLVGPGPFLANRQELVVAHSAKLAIPALYGNRAAVLAGGMASYGARVEDGYRQAGIYTGRVLKGEKPANLPIMQVNKFELVINLKSARALGLTFSPTILARVDEVVDQ